MVDGRADLPVGTGRPGQPEPRIDRQVGALGRFGQFQRLAGVVEKGGAVALARCRDSGGALGAGLYSPPLEGVTEIAAIGVREEARGRGIGGAVTALLADHAFVQGVSFPFLMTASGNENRVYGRAGFHRFGELIGVTR